MHTDTIFLQNLLFIGNHGVGAPERSKPQRLEIDVTLEVVGRDRKDNIKRTYNYMDAHEIVRRHCEEYSYKLIETLAEAVAQDILEDTQVVSASVTVRKLDILKRGVCGVTITRPLL